MTPLDARAEAADQAAGLHWRGEFCWCREQHQDDAPGLIAAPWDRPLRSIRAA